MLEGMEAGWSQSLDKLAATLTSAREIVITRVFNAPRELVFAAWTDPVHIGRWYGPNGFSITMQEMDVRPGGYWRFIMHGPDGTDYLNENQYLEIVKPERLVYLHGPTPKFQATVTFENDNGKTRLTLRTTFATAEERDYIVKTFHAIEGGNQTLARLAEFLGVSNRMTRALWIIQILLALLFLFAGGVKLVMPAAQLTAGGPLPAPFLRFIGVAEIAGALGLFLPGALRIRPGLTPLAAAGLTIIMIGATVITVMTMSAAIALLPFLVGALTVFVAYARWRPHPLAR